MSNVAVHHGRDFTFTATGTLGLKRCTMAKNELHQRSQLAKSKPHCFKIPNSNFTYGIRTDKQGGVQDAMTWLTETPSACIPTRPTSAFATPTSRQTGCPGRDFVNINREAVKAGLVSSKELGQYRATQDQRLHTAMAAEQNGGLIGAGKHSRGTRKGGLRTQSVPPPGAAFGVNTRPSTPIADLMSYRFQDDWINHQIPPKSTCGRSFTASAKVGQDGKGPGGTRSTQLKSYVVPLDPSPPWKMFRFDRKAKPFVNTFRTESARRAAMNWHMSDKVGRSGLQGHGIYI